MELSAIKAALAERSEEVCRHLLPGGKIEKGEWKCGDLSSAEGKSLGVVLHGEKAGLWRDFASAVGGSNLLELWVQTRRLPFQTALAEAKEWLASRGVRQEHGVDPRPKKAYAKPSTKGVTWIASKAEFYLTTERKIPREIVDLYKIAMTDDEQAIVFPYLHQTTAKAEMLKFLRLERDEKGKKVTWTSKDTPKVLFGKHTRRPEDRYLLITEGEVDAMSWRAQNVPQLCCTSVPFGAKWEGKDGKDPNDEWIENDWEFLQTFERIYLSMDMDEEGRKAQASLVKRLGREVCFIVELPTKDANELVQAERGAELLKCFEAARTLDPAELKNAGEFKKAVLDRMYSQDQNTRRGIPLPFGSHPFHLRWHEWTALTGQNGSGKTTVLSYLLNYLHKLGYGSCIASLEVPAEQTLEFQVMQATGQELPPQSQAEAALDWLSRGFWFYDHVGRVDWKNLIATWRYAYRRHGIRFFVLDSWLKLGIDPEDLSAQGEVISAISDFVRDYPVHVFVVAHPRKLKNEIEVVGKMDIKGTGQLTDEAHNVVIVWRNKAKEEEIEKMMKLAAGPNVSEASKREEEAKIIQKRRSKPDAQWIVRKQRNALGQEPTIDLWYIVNCKQYYGHFREAGISMIENEPVPTPPASEPQENLDEDMPF